MKTLIPIIAAVGALAIALPAMARDLSVVLKTKNRGVLLIDRDSVKHDEDDPGQRTAMLSIDNSRSTGAAALYAADVAMRADCTDGRIAIVWSRAYAPDGRESTSAAPPAPHTLKQPAGAMERAALNAICGKS